MLRDAKARFLKPGGIMLPAEIELLLAPVESQACRRTVSEWRDGTVPVDYSWISETAANTKHGVDLGAAEPLCVAQALCTLTMGDEPGPYYAWRTKFELARSGLLDGLAGCSGRDCTATSG